MITISFHVKVFIDMDSKGQPPELITRWIEDEIQSNLESISVTDVVHGVTADVTMIGRELS